MLQFMDDFTSYGTDSSRVDRMLNGVYAEAGFVNLIADPDPSALGQYVLDVNSNSTAVLRKVLTAPQTTVGVAARYYFTALPADATVQPNPVLFSDSNNLLHVYVVIDPSGYYQVYRADTGGPVLIGSSAQPQMVANAWRHVEIKVVFGASGSVEIRQEGYTVLLITGVRTLSNSGAAIASCQNVSLRNNRGATFGPDMLVKDFIIWDGTGSVNNNFLGSCKVYKIVPDSDVTLNWTTSTGSTGWNLINETTPSDDVGYIYAPYPAPSPSTFTLTDLPVNVTSVKGVQAMTRSRKSDGGDAQMQVSVISGSNTGNGTDRPIATNYIYTWDMFDLDPSGIAWTKPLVDALKIKLNRTV